MTDVDSASQASDEPADVGLTNSIAATSRWMAAARARETQRPDRLFSDPLAAELAGTEGFGWLQDMETAAGSDLAAQYPVIRTRFFDDFLLDASQRMGVGQIVLVAAGLDTRAFRLPWPPGTRLYEIDLPAVLNAKDDTIAGTGATPICERVTVAVDLQDATWPQRLLAGGYRPDRPSVWLIEGLLYYLARPAVHALLEQVRALTAVDSRLGLDLMNRGLFLFPPAWPMQAALAGRGAAGRFGTNTPGALLAAHGFDPDVSQPGDDGANFGRWPRPLVPRTMPGWPRSFLVRSARRS